MTKRALRCDQETERSHHLRLLFSEKLMNRHHCLLTVLDLVLAAVVVAVGAGESKGALVYWNSFDDLVTDGVPDVTAGGGTLAVNTTGANLAIFTNAGGVFGGRMSASANPNGAFNGVALASTTLTGGSDLSNLPDQTGGGTGMMNQFTVSFWYNVATFSTSTTSSLTHRLLTLGNATAADITASTGLGFHVRHNGSGSGGTPNPRTIALLANNVDVSAAGAGSGFEGTEVNTGTWAFVALTYDGTSSNGDNSTIQSTATGAASSVNGQLYWGTSALAVTRSNAPLTTVAGDATASNLGTINFGNAARIILANNLTPNRSFDGSIDDIRIYDGVLSSSQVEDVRLQGLIGVPEPSAIVLSSLMILGAVLLQRGRRK
jgi:hypothetical protein